MKYNVIKYFTDENGRGAFLTDNGTKIYRGIAGEFPLDFDVETLQR